MCRARKLVATALIASALLVAMPGHAKHPPLIVATIAAWAPPAFIVGPGETVQFTTSDVPHSFVTDAAICTGSLGQLVPCDALISGTLGRTSVRIDPRAPRGTYPFRCGIHPAWMIGRVVVD